jgi:CTP synthase
LDEVDGVVVPGGFGERGTEGKIKVIKGAREKNIPFLGLCFGMQLAIVEFARNVCNLKGANSTEIDPDTPHPVIDILPEQRGVKQKGGTMRLGTFPAVLKKGSLVYSLYQQEEVSERHRHRYEVNPAYHSILQEKGMVFSGMSKDGRLVEFIELPNHIFFVATQAHPELKSRMEKPAPLFYGFVKACIERKEKGKNE